MSAVPRLLERYRRETLPELKQQFKYQSAMAVPKLKKIIVNMGVGEARENIKALDAAAEEMAHITGQRAAITRAKKSIANFKIRAGMPVGCRVTLRGARMYEFFDRLVNIALPRVRDFKGVSEKAFDGRGNYTLGITDQLIFPELAGAKVEKIKGMNITIVTTARSDPESRALLTNLGLPFRKP
jgi:large subunit ribosomal protein L5